MDWVKKVLRIIKPFAIIMLAIVFTVLWLQVPDYKLNEEVKNASEQSKRSTQSSNYRRQ